MPFFDANKTMDSYHFHPFHPSIHPSIHSPPSLSPSLLCHIPSLSRSLSHTPSVEGRPPSQVSKDQGRPEGKGGGCGHRIIHGWMTWRQSGSGVAVATRITRSSGTGIHSKCDPPLGEIDRDTGPELRSGCASLFPPNPE